MKIDFIAANRETVEITVSGTKLIVSPEEKGIRIRLEVREAELPAAEEAPAAEDAKPDWPARYFPIQMDCSTSIAEYLTPEDEERFVSMLKELREDTEPDEEN